MASMTQAQTVETDAAPESQTARPCVFVHTNHKQWIGALVSQYSLKRNSPNGDAFDVKIIHTDDHRFLHDKEGQPYLRDGLTRHWLVEDLQSFTPLRFMPPKLMGYQGRAVIIDPDIFAVGDIHELLTRDMQGKAIMCRARPGKKAYASSVMLLDCAKLRHWDCEAEFEELFAFKRDYMDWVTLKCEAPETIGLFEREWNDFDHLNAQTKLLHNTKRSTQPWKTGLKVDYTPPLKKGSLLSWLRRARESVFGRYGLRGSYKRHPDPNQERFFFQMLRACIEDGVVSEELLRQEMANKHIRPDAFQVIERMPPLPAPAAAPKPSLAAAG